MYFEETKYQGYKIITLYVDQKKDYTIGSVEMIEEKGYNYIENIYFDVEYRHRGYLREVIDYLKSTKKLICLPLPQHVEKFKHLGFTFYKQKGDDTYYSIG